MHRTQIYFDDFEWSNLKLLASNKNKSVSELIRNAVKSIYFKENKYDFDKALNDISGLWKDRDVDSLEYVNSLRKSRRSKTYESYS